MVTYLFALSLIFLKVARIQCFREKYSVGSSTESGSRSSIGSSTEASRGPRNRRASIANELGDLQWQYVAYRPPVERSPFCRGIAWTQDKYLKSGTNGDVFKVSANIGGRKVIGAMKTARNHEQAIKQIRTEKRVMRAYSLQQCGPENDGGSGLARLYDDCPQNGEHAYVMEFADSGDLDAWIDKHPGQHGLAQCGAYLKMQMYNALTCLHDSGYVHMDLKADQFLLSAPPRGKQCPARVILIDYGMAIWMGHGMQMQPLVHPQAALFHQYVDSIIHGRPDPLGIKDPRSGSFRPDDAIDWCAFTLMVFSQMGMHMHQIFNRRQGIDCGFMGPGTMQQKLPPPQMGPHGPFQPPPVEVLERPIRVAY